MFIIVNDLSSKMVSMSSFLKIFILHIFLISFINIDTYSQKVKNSDSDLKLSGEANFKKKDYAAALPSYSQLLSIYPTDPLYNYRYGVCLVETNTQTSKAVNYLTFAISKNVNPNSYFYLGKAFHLNYKFDEAIRNYNKFKEVGSKSEVKEFNVDRYIEMCNNGKELIRYVSDLMVLDNKQLRNEDFYRSYDISDFGGRILFLPEDFMSSNDKSEKIPLLMFLSEKLGVAYYASYGKSKKNGTDIYRRTRLADGTWSEEENLGLTINTPFDENYPYIHPDGQTLYFCSKGHNSMGGYDIYRSTYDFNNKQWSKPVNMDFPINSPYDDIMYTSDAKENVAFFASNRETGNEKISIYKIKVDKNPIEKEFIDIEEVIEKSKLEVSPLVASVTASESELKMTNSSNNNELKVSNLNLDAYTFPSLKPNTNASKQEVALEAKKDADILKTESKSVKRDANYTLVIAQKKLNEAYEKRKQANNVISSINNSLNDIERDSRRKKAKELNDEADKLERHAVAAYNLGRNLDKVSVEKSNEAENNDRFYKRISDSGQDVNDMADEINKNRQRLNLGQNKFTTFDTELSKRRKLVETKSKDLDSKVKRVKQLKQETENLDNEIKKLKEDLNNPQNQAYKDKIQEELINKSAQLNSKKIQEKELIATTQKLKIDVENLNEEVQFLLSFSNELSDANTNINLIAEQVIDLDKEKLAKEIEEKEFNVDKLYIAEVAEKKDDTNIEKLEKDSKDVIIKTNQTTDKQNQADELFKQAKRNEQVVDSIQILIDEKKSNLNNITDQKKKENLQKEISELEYLAQIKKQQSDKKFAQALDKEKQANSQVNVETEFNQKAFPFAGGTSSKQDEYEKELFKAQYHENIATGFKKNADLLKAGVDTISHPVIKQSLIDAIAQLEANYNENKRLSDNSYKNAENLKSSSPNEIKEANLSSSELLVKATNYESVNEIPLDDKQKMQLESAPHDRKAAENYLKSWEDNRVKIEKLINESKSASNQKNKDKLKKEANDLLEKSYNDYNLYSETNSLLNSEEYDVLSEVIEDNRIVANNSDIKLAHSLENEAKIYFEKGRIIRKNAKVIDDIFNRIEEIEKANDMEKIAISKQKNAIDIYLEAKNKGVKSNEYIANNEKVLKDNATTLNSNTSVSGNQEITLLFEEEQALQNYREKEYQANSMINESNKQLENLEANKVKVNTIKNNKEKAKLIAEINAKENEIKNNILNAYKQHGSADSAKYFVYKNQLSLMIDSLFDIGNNTNLAKQYINESDFYYAEAQKIRASENSEANLDNKINSLKKATELEKKALDNQEVAVNIMMDVDPVVFAADNNLVKVDILEQLNKPVNVAHIKAKQEQMVLEKIKLTKDDVEAFDASKVKLAEADDQMKQGDAMLTQAEEMRNAAEKTSNAKEKKKALKEAEKIEAKGNDLKFRAAENYELVNNTKFSIYEDYVKNVRLKDNSEEARQGRQLEKDANLHFTKAKKLRDKYYMTKNADYNLLLEANELELKAVEEMELAYGIYLNIPSVEEMAKKDSSLLALKTTSGINEDLVLKTRPNITPIENNNTTNNKTLTESTNNNKTVNVGKDNVNNIIIGESINVDKNNVTGTVKSSDKLVSNVNNKSNVGDGDFIFGFSLKNSSPYSNSNPIPLNVKLPDCIVFKVQIGAFMNPIEQDAFKGMYPMTGEKLPNNKFTRYFVGMFRSIEASRMVLSQVRQMGYPDAFIVAYIDGLKVSQQQALNMINSGTDNCVNGYDIVAQKEVEMVKSQATSGSDLASRVTNVNTNKTIAETVGREEIKTTDIKSVDGLLYSVQIGVFKNLPTSDKIFNLNPLYTEQTESGFIRLTTGVFNDYESARNEKNKIVQLGIEDAFVVSYMNGKRLSTDEANKILTQGNVKKASEASVRLPESSSIATTSKNIIFKIQVGAYEKQVPTNVVSSLLKIASMKDFEQKVNDKGVTIYTVGKFEKYEDAQQMKNVVVNDGVKDAFVTAYQDGKVIPVEEALKIINQ